MDLAITLAARNLAVWQTCLSGKNISATRFNIDRVRGKLLLQLSQIPHSFT